MKAVKYRVIIIWRNQRQRRIVASSGISASKRKSAALKSKIGVISSGVAWRQKAAAAAHAWRLMKQ